MSRIHHVKIEMMSLGVQANTERRATMSTKTRIGATVGEMAYISVSEFLIRLLLFIAMTLSKAT